MNWDAVGAIAELAGAIAVVLTLLYLAIQIRNQNRQARDASAQWGTSEFNALRLATMQDDRLAKSILESRDSLEHLDAIAAVQVYSRFDFIFATIWAQFQSVQNNTSALTIETLRSSFEDLAASKVAAEVWSRLRDRYPPDFQQFVDEMIDTVST